MKYFEIHVFCASEDCGYSVFVSAENENKAVQKAKDNGMFVFKHDHENIEYIEEIDKDEYDRAMTLDKVFGMILGQWENC